jgi:hypothetical protein
MALYHLKATGEFNAAVHEWEQKPTPSNTWSNIKTFISMEYSKENKQNKLTAKRFSANAIQEQAEATEELIATLTEAHTRQMENLVRSTTEAMKEMMLLLKENKNSNISVTNEEKNKKETRKKRNTTTHQFANIVARSNHQKLKTNVGNQRKIKTLAHQPGNPTKALDGVRGPS